MLGNPIRFDIYSLDYVIPKGARPSSFLPKSELVEDKWFVFPAQIDVNPQSSQQTKPTEMLNAKLQIGSSSSKRCSSGDGGSSGPAVS